MACKVLQMKYAFCSKADTWPPEIMSTGVEVLVPFRTNFLHDLESVFWSFTWVLYCHTDTNNHTSNLDSRLREFTSRSFFQARSGNVYCSCETTSCRIVTFLQMTLVMLLGALLPSCIGLWKALPWWRKNIPRSM